MGQSTAELGSLLDEGQVMYALGRYKTKFDMSTTVKFVYFRWSVSCTCVTLLDHKKYVFKRAQQKADLS